ncbi:MAG: hypothetical protein J6S45_00065, partial [Firmicutes bacterium]|nr:hypothetical protein [Bacillota bacterium]
GGFLILTAAIHLIKKMKKAAVPRAILVLATLIMLLVNIFSWNFSSISLMLIAGAIGLAAFFLQGSPAPGGQKGGESK